MEIDAYSEEELADINAHVDCVNEQRAPITIDFEVIGKRIGKASLVRS